AHTKSPFQICHRGTADTEDRNEGISKSLSHFLCVSVPLWLILRFRKSTRKESTHHAQRSRRRHDFQPAATATRQPVRGRPRAALVSETCAAAGRAPRGRAVARRTGRTGGRRALPLAARRPSERAATDALGRLGREG